MSYKRAIDGTALTAEFGNDNYMDQVISTFTNAADRDNKVVTPKLGQHVYLESTNTTLRYEGPSRGWVEMLPAKVGDLVAKPLRVCTSTTRPSHSAGQEIYETDTGRKLISNGTKWTITGGLIPSVAVAKNVQTNLTQLAWTAMPFEVVIASESNTPAMWSTSNPTRLVAPVDGTYLASGSLGFIVPSSGASHRYLAIRKNNGQLRRLSSAWVTQGSEGEMNGTLSFRMAAGDYVELMYYTGFGGDKSKEVNNPAENNPGFSLVYLGGI